MTTEEAIEHYGRALRLKPDLAAAEMNLGRVLLAVGRTTEAEAHLRAALRLDPELPHLKELLEDVRR